MQLKTIDYNDGYASFRIPEHWVEEEEKEGSLHFYDEDSDDIFSLRVSILTFAAPEGMANPSTEDFMGSSGIPAYAEKLMIDSNNLLAIHQDREDYEEENEHYINHYWEYIHKKSNGQFDLAIFTWSIDAALENNPIYDNFSRLISEEVKKLTFKD